MSASTSSALDLRSMPLPAAEEGDAIKAPERHDAIAQRAVHDGPESDGHLMQRYCAGDQGAFQLLYSRYRAPLRRFVTRLAGNSGEAEEIFQEVWTAVIHSRRSYRPTAKFSTYLFSIAHRRLRDRQRRYWRWVAAFGGSASPLTPEELVDDRAAPPEACIHDVELRRALLAAIDTLPAPQREVFLLKAETDMSLEEIAAATGAKLEATKSRLRYAVARLRATEGLAMSGPGYQTDEQIPEELVSAYRASVEDPPYDATDRALLRAAACRDTSRWPRLTSYAASRSFVAALAVVALVICASQVQRITSIFRGGNIDRQGLSRFFPAPIRTAKPVTPAGDYTPQDRKLRQAQGAADQKGPHDDEYLMNTMFGATYARENQLEQAAMALQFAADSQYATLALQAQATEPDLYAMELAERALRVQ